MLVTPNWRVKPTPATARMDAVTMPNPIAGTSVLTSASSALRAGGPIVFNQWHNSTGAFEAAKYLKGNPVIVGSVSAAQIASLSR